jgi:short-subunit dehydrogenase
MMKTAGNPDDESGREEAVGRTVALVTGASSGLGVDFAKELASRGHDLLVTARRLNRLESLKREIEGRHNVEVSVFDADLGDPGGANRVLDELKRKDMKADVLINSAGYGTRSFILDKKPGHWEQMIQVNLNSLVTLTMGVLPAMVERRAGKILNVSSTAGLQASPYFTVYAATKAFVLLFSEGLTKELKDRNSNVKVTCLCPGPTRTEFASVAEVGGMSAPDYMWMESQEVVKIGLKALEDNEGVCIPGASNKIHACTAKWMPRKLLTEMLGKMNKP